MAADHRIVPPAMERGPRLAGVRNLVDDLGSALRGWTFIDAHHAMEPDATWRPIGRATTPIKARGAIGTDNQNRLHNMALACAMITNVWIPPGYAFSFRKAVGRPTESRGFRSGPTLIRGELRRSTGGGLCQISSTLFNAALSANLDILERHGHSVDLWGPERFVALGRDATFAWALKDLKIRNNHSAAVVLRMRTDPGLKQVDAEVLSREPLDCSVRVESRVLRRIDPPADADWVPGWEVLTTRSVVSGDSVRPTYRATDVYRPTPGP